MWYTDYCQHLGHCRRRKIPVYGFIVLFYLYRYYRDADVVLLVFDLSNYSTFKDLEYWVSELDYRLQKQDLMVIVVGNKVDRNPRAV